MYESPIILYMTDIQTQIIKQQEEQIVKAVQSVAVGVDHDELFRALKYDRDQYNKGYQDGKPKWTPVSERLPDERCFVLVFTIFRTVGEALFDGHGQFYWSNTDEYEEPLFVTHWMPLPEPPKEDL